MIYGFILIETVRSCTEESLWLLCVNIDFVSKITQKKKIKINIYESPLVISISFQGLKSYFTSRKPRLNSEFTYDLSHNRYQPPMASSSNPPKIDTRFLIHTRTRNQANMGPSLQSDKYAEYITSDQLHAPKLLLYDHISKLNILSSKSIAGHRRMRNNTDSCWG